VVYGLEHEACESDKFEDKATTDEKRFQPIINANLQSNVDARTLSSNIVLPAD